MLIFKHCLRFVLAPKPYHKALYEFSSQPLKGKLFQRIKPPSLNKLNKKIFLMKNKKKDDARKDFRSILCPQHKYLENYLRLRKYELFQKVSLYL